MEYIAIELAIHAWIGHKDFRRAALDNSGEHLYKAQVLARLSGQDHGGILLAPRLQRFDDISFDDWMPQQSPSFVNGKELECRRVVGERGIGAMQNIKEQRLQLIGGRVHSFEIECLERRHAQSILGVIK